MAAGTPRPAFLNTQAASESGKAWMSFEESPVHTTGGVPVQQEERWTSFTDPISQTLPVDTGMQIQMTSPVANYIGQPRVPIVSQLQQNPSQQPRSADPTILNRTGIGTDVAQHTPQLQTHPHPVAHVAHSNAQSATVTHGPGSTISHILRHTSGDADHEAPIDRLSASTKLQTDVALVDKVPSLPQPQAEITPQTAENYYGTGPGNMPNENAGHDPWFVTDEQSTYYRNQFLTMQSNIDGKIDGHTARNFFTKSRLPIPELSHIWELCDMDQDGHLTLLEFCAAFHLVVARKNSYKLPTILPKTLLPPLMKMRGTGQKNVYVNRNLIAPTDVTPKPEKSPVKEPQRREEKVPNIVHHPVVTKAQTSESKTEEPAPQPRAADSSQWQTQERWETFSDRTSSSTNLANFDQSLENTDNIVHPVPLRITPSKHEAHAAKIRKEKEPPKSTDDEEHHVQGLAVPPAHKSLTNPYGPLQNNLSEPDSHTSPRARSSSNSSHSSAGTSDRSMCENDTGFKPPKLNPSDQEYQSDWSSRPLQPRSGSDSSIESSSLEASVIARETPGTVPTPPPRPNYQMRNAKIESLEGEKIQHSAADVPDSANVPMSAPTPPPRPQQQTVAKTAEQNESFADFSQFEKIQNEDSTAKDPTTKEITPVPEPTASQPDEKQASKPKPAPRLNREEKAAKPETKDDKSPDKGAHRKAPTKPPRSRIQSVDSSLHEQNKIIKSNSVTSPSDDIPVIAEKPNQGDGRSKVSLQKAIRDLKLQNSKLTRLNADLQQELKDVMQSRITVEMSIHHLRPFSQ